jgi:hypothetical protein
MPDRFSGMGVNPSTKIGTTPIGKHCAANEDLIRNLATGKRFRAWPTDWVRRTTAARS